MSQVAELRRTLARQVVHDTAGLCARNNLTQADLSAILRMACALQAQAVAEEQQQQQKSPR